MGFFGDSDGDDLDFGKHSSGILFGSLKIIGRTLGKSFRDLQNARQLAAMRITAAAEERAHLAMDEDIAIARPNLKPLQPKNK